MARDRALRQVTAALILLPAPALWAEDDLPPEVAPGRAQRGPQPAPARALNLYSLLSEPEVDAELARRHVAAGDLPALLERVTRGLVAAPYLLSPLGEGSGVDPDPRFRLDAFDCTTFVETALALTRCDGLAEARQELDRLRYHAAEARFDRRHHLMTSDWIPSLVRAGVLTDATVRLGRGAARQVELELTPARWKRRRVARALELGELPLGRHALAYLPVSWVRAHAAELPPGLVLNVVRAEVPWSPELITHQGILVQRPGEATRYVRHASPVSKRVIDEPLVRMMERYHKPKPWPVLGINLLEIVPPGPEASGAEARAR